jgi:hypothetical protein
MSKRTREKKAPSLSNSQSQTRFRLAGGFAQPYAKARLLIDHPHSYREWNIVGQCDVPGFFYLESRLA